jgi:hypothetical protein
MAGITITPSFRLQCAHFRLDDSALDAATTLKQHAEAIRLLVRRTCRGIVEIGYHLTEVRELAGHGKWLRWLDHEFGWSEQTARNYMRVYEMDKSTTIVDLDLPLRALYVLAAPSTPESVREGIIERAASGEKISYEQVGQEVAEAVESRERERKAPPSYKTAPEPPTLKEIFDRIIDLAAQLNREDQLRIARRIQNMAMGRAFSTNSFS